MLPKWYYRIVVASDGRGVWQTYGKRQTDTELETGQRSVAERSVVERGVDQVKYRSVVDGSVLNFGHAGIGVFF